MKSVYQYEVLIDGKLSKYFCTIKAARSWVKFLRKAGYKNLMIHRLSTHQI